MTIIRIEDVVIVDDVPGRDDQPEHANCHAHLGITGKLGSDIFTFDVCNKLWAKKYSDMNGLGFNGNLLILNKVRKSEIIDFLNVYINRYEWDSFKDFIDNSSANIHWEFS